MPRKRNKTTSEQVKYLSRCHYAGKLVDWEYVNGAMVLKLQVYTATEYYGNTTYVRIYVPTEDEHRLSHRLITGGTYSVWAAPYRVHFNNKYPYRVDLLLSIAEII